MSAAYRAYPSRPNGVTPWALKETGGAGGKNVLHYVVHAGECFCRVQVNETDGGHWVLGGTKTKFSSTSAVMNHVKIQHREDWDNIQKASGLDVRKGGKKTAEEKNAAELEFANQLEKIFAADNKAEKSARIQIANSMEVQSSFSQPTAQNAPGLKKRKTVAESEDEEDEIDSNAAADAAKHKQKKRKVVEKQTKTATKAKQGKGKGKK